MYQINQHNELNSSSVVIKLNQEARFLMMLGVVEVVVMGEVV
jgi:hypothetical protein